MDGIILINKEKGYTSHDIVAIAKKTLGEKIGHTGTLDPDATGVLPLLVGKATKISKYIINHDKVYKAVLKLGIKTDTLDATGNIIEEVSVTMPSKEEIEKVFSSMIGLQEQTPPMYSAIKVNGKKLYEYARQGKTVEIEPRKIEIYSLKLENINTNEHEITFTVNCSKGTYIRSLCEQIAQNLKTIGHMKELNRLQVGDFKIENSVTISELKENKESAVKYIITIEQFFKDKEKIVLDNKQLEQFLNGVKLQTPLQDGICKIYNNENLFIGLGIVQDGALKRDVIV
jgi:tRNA pseudouridine55 synthase